MPEGKTANGKRETNIHRETVDYICTLCYPNNEPQLITFQLSHCTIFNDMCGNKKGLCYS